MADYIERERYCAYLRSRTAEFLDDYGKGWSNGIESAMRIARKFPEADVAPVVHGQWKACFEDWRRQIEGDQCSACGFAHYGTTIRDYNYCPNCGARMDGEDGEDNEAADV